MAEVDDYEAWKSVQRMSKLHEALRIIFGNDPADDQARRILRRQAKDRVMGSLDGQA